MDTSNFKPRDVLRLNLIACMQGKHGPKTQTALKQKTGVAQATIGRILSEVGENARIETITKIARAYGLECWQLLVPGMNPSNPPVLQPVSKEERALYARLQATIQDLAKLKP